MSASPPLDRVVSLVHSRRADAERWLRDLVEICSHTADRAGVNAAQDLYSDIVGIPTERVSGAPTFGDHLVIHAGARASAGGCVLVGHMDTVFPRDRFAGYRSEGGIARGPGVLDMKGGLVVIAIAVRALRDAGVLDRLPLSIVVVSDEEVGSPHSAATLSAVARGARAALVFESGRAGDRIITSRKGSVTFAVTAHGRAAHAGNAHADGANAIWALARFVDRAQLLTDYPRGVTVNVGVVHGGLGKNTVPDAARCEVDTRFVRAEDGPWLRSQIAENASLAAQSVPGTRIETAETSSRTPLVRSDANVALMERYADCQREAGLGAGDMPLVGGGSDASTTADVGVPSIDALGPRGAGFHTLDEHVELDTLIPKAEALARFLLGMQTGNGTWQSISAT